MKSARDGGTGSSGVTGLTGVGAPATDPARLGRYLLSGVVARGSMATIYRSTDPRTQHEVAIKAVRLEGASHQDEENLSARLRIEAEVAGSLRHPGILTIHEYGEEGAYAFAVMDYVEGESLKASFERGLEFGTARAIDLITQLLEALQYAHDRGVWHRDIKPSNILVGIDGRLRLTDFGIARRPTVPHHLEAILGTPGYVAPESYLSDSVDSRVDIFAAGAVLYQLLTGVPAFAGTADQIMFKVCHETAPPPSRVAGMTTLARYDAAVMKALQRRPEDRFSSAAEFRQALRSA